MLNKITDLQKTAFFSSCIFGFLAHGYMLTNKITSHDDLGSMYGAGGGIANGRWMTGYYEQLFHMINSPWSNGLIVIFLMAISAVMLVKILNIKTQGTAVAMSAIWVTHPCLISTLFYMFTSVPYIIGLSLSILAIWLLVDKINIFRSQLAVLCIIMSLGFYQAFFSVAASLLLIVLIQCIIQLDKSPIKIIKAAVVFLLILSEGMLGYILTQKALVRMTGLELTSYQNMNSLGNVNFDVLPQQIADAYKHFFSSWSFFGIDLPVFKVADILLCLFLCITTLYFICNYIAERQFFKFFCFAVVVCIFPLACNLVYLYGAEGVHSLMVWGNVCAVFLLIVLATNIKNNKISEQNLNKITSIMCGLIILLAIYNCVLSSRVYLQQEYIVNASINYLGTVVTQIKSVDGYGADMPVALVGLCDDSVIYSIDAMYKQERIAGTNTMWQIVNTVIRADWLRNTFFSKYLGFSAVFLNVDECEELRLDPRVQTMAIYPNSGSIGIIDNIVVVHFSN